MKQFLIRSGGKMPAFSRRRHGFAIPGLVTVLLLSSCATTTTVPQSLPKERGTFRKADLVELVKLDPTIHLDVRYATPNNFTGQPVYRQARAFLQRDAAEALVRVNRALHEKGWGIVVFDGYRPWSVTKHFWEITPKDKRDRGFVANPAKGSKHNRGAAVDLSMYELSSGKEADMPSGYDEFSDRAAPSYTGGTAEQRQRRDLLRAEMEKEGFVVDTGEWWHFNFKGWETYPILDIPFEQIP
jgi:D-alanyl-D-alanine dipeptidase